MGLSTHRTNTANPRRTQLDVAPIPAQRTEPDVAELRTGPTANPRRTNLVDDEV
ncbi:hypothetical protein [Yinghuangia seranimata]|uniref:hypothetical protein n=1 Tax=Yinghuangia seranimata TaxID=408067 RepID=UPI00248B0F63|nr:hypothetical protein [Yinghuangia seranimata]MDI2129326.1 hypothetical protein [Yinghuangia seranimata]